MKQMRFGFAVLLSISFLAGCSGATVDDPPEFVEMYLDDEEVVVPPAESISTGLYNQKIDYDDAIYSDTNFQVVVTTNGANYDLLYSVELNDSELGECVYTD